jgi:ribosomal protein L19
MKYLQLNLFLLFTLFVLTSNNSFSQSSGVEGRITNDSGEGLGYATIYIRNIETGTTSNDAGYFHVKLAPGKYDFVFQYLGYETQVVFIEVGESMQQTDIKLKSVSYRLREFEVSSDREDPAYTIMRKAMAKSSFHRQQLDAYKAQVYIKGSGRLLDAPFFLRKKIAKEGVDSNMAFTSESVIDIEYTRPNTYKQNVISVRTSGDDSNTSPNGYVFGSYYEPNINDAISPLSPRALLHYYFKYLGSFTDRGYTINMIKVIPKSKGDNLFAGDLFIIDDLWSIYSLDLQTESYGILFDVKVIFSPIEEKVWMPISHQFDITASIMGFDVVGTYLAVVSDYDITLNPDLDYTFEVIDEKIEEEKADSLELSKPKKPNKLNPLIALNTEEELTRKQLKKIIKEYEKIEMEEMNSENISTIYIETIDSLASRKDSAYWNNVRPIPLNDYEVLGYQKLDSIAEADYLESKKDSVKESQHKWFDFFLGGGYKIGEKQHFRMYSMLEQINFNTVDGIYMGYKVHYRIETSENSELRFTPKVRYAFSRKVWTGTLKTEFDFGADLREGTIVIEGGRFTSQFNKENPIDEINNAFTTLFLEQNFMKIYEKNFLLLEFDKRLSDKISIQIGSEFAERTSLQNTSDYTLIDWKTREYSSNNPKNLELEDTQFPTHQSWTSELGLKYRPWLRFNSYEGKKREIQNSSPTFSFVYRKGIKADFSVIDFDQLEFGFKHKVKIGAGAALSINLKTGGFLNDNQMTFVEYKHFLGNRSPFETNDPVASYRLLPYYDYSTTGAYLNTHILSI